jgi:YidC/Oxa1 family membrane protein insertase
MVEHYFISAWVPEASQKNHFYSSDNKNQVFTIGVVGPEFNVPAGKAYDTQWRLYAGPAEVDRLTPAAPNLGLTVDYGWLWIICEPIFWVLEHVHNIIGNWGWAIVLVTVLIKAIFYPLSAMSYRSMAAMRALQPKIEALKLRYADDKQKLTQATMELYRKEKANPFSGCFPVIIQVPVFIALYYVLMESVELRQAPFIFWIEDLSTRDPYFILPILMGLSMVLQQRLSPSPLDPTQAKMMMLLPVFFTFIFLFFPSGLVLYWLVNNLLSVSQQWYITKTYHKPATHKRKK